MSDENEDNLALCEIIREFIRVGTGCDAQSRNGQNVFHLGLKCSSFINAVLETEMEEHILKALRTRDKQGYTPITLALETGEEDVALLLLERTNYDIETLSGPSVHAQCVSSGANRTFNLLLRNGVELNPSGANGKTLLHYVGPRTEDEFVSQLLGMFPNGLHCRMNGMTPLSTYLERCIYAEIPALNANVVRLLATSGSDGERKEIWDNLALLTQAVRHARSDRGPSNSQCVNCTTEAVTCLLQLGFIESYEADARVNGALHFLKHFRVDLDELWPISSEAIRGVLEHTTLWEPLRGDTAILRLLKAAVKSSDFSLVDTLLENGVSVHERIDGVSALEVACLQPVAGTAGENLFSLLLDHAESSRLNEINPHKGQDRGVIHYLVGREKQWQLKELLKRGVDVNLCTNIHVRAQPAVVHHLWEDSPESAIILLEMGANTTTSDSRGMDAALAASTTGRVDVLMHLHGSSQGRQLNWGQTCGFTDKSRGGMDFYVSGANALHLAAINGHSDVLRFYLDKCLLMDLDTVSNERFTPLHLASFSGKINAVRFLHSKGADLNLKSAHGNLPLHLAVQQGQVEVIEFLLANGSCVDADSYGLTPVEYALGQEKSILDCFITKKQYLNHLSKPEKRAQALAFAYEQALRHGDVKECERLRQQGFPVNADLLGHDIGSKLFWAIENSHEEMIQWLLDHDVKTTCRTFRTNRGWLSPIHAMLARRTPTRLLPLLLKNNRDEGGSIIHEEPSLICDAISFGNSLGLKLLLNHLTTHETTQQSRLVT